MLSQGDVLWFFVTNQSVASSINKADVVVVAVAFLLSWTALWGFLVSGGIFSQFLFWKSTHMWPRQCTLINANRETSGWNSVQVKRTIIVSPFPDLFEFVLPQKNVSIPFVQTKTYTGLGYYYIRWSSRRLCNFLLQESLCYDRTPTSVLCPFLSVLSVCLHSKLWSCPRYCFVYSHKVDEQTVVHWRTRGKYKSGQQRDLVLVLSCCVMSAVDHIDLQQLFFCNYTRTWL